MSQRLGLVQRIAVSDGHQIVSQLKIFGEADPQYGRGVAAKVGVDMDAFAGWADLSLQELIQKTSEENFNQPKEPVKG